MVSVEAMGLEPTNLLTASQALYQLSYAPGGALRLPAASKAEVGRPCVQVGPSR
jgi:hypothetical protein